MLDELDATLAALDDEFVTLELALLIDDVLNVDELLPLPTDELDTTPEDPLHALIIAVTATHEKARINAVGRFMWTALSLTRAFTISCLVLKTD